MGYGLFAKRGTGNQTTKVNYTETRYTSLLSTYGTKRFNIRTASGNGTNNCVRYGLVSSSEKPDSNAYFGLRTGSDQQNCYFATLHDFYSTILKWTNGSFTGATISINPYFLDDITSYSNSIWNRTHFYMQISEGSSRKGYYIPYRSNYISGINIAHTTISNSTSILQLYRFENTVSQDFNQYDMYWTQHTINNIIPFSLKDVDIIGTGNAISRKLVLNFNSNNFTTVKNKCYYIVNTSIYRNILSETISELSYQRIDSNSKSSRSTFYQQALGDSGIPWQGITLINSFPDGSKMKLSLTTIPFFVSYNTSLNSDIIYSTITTSFLSTYTILVRDYELGLDLRTYNLNRTYIYAIRETIEQKLYNFNYLSTFFTNLNSYNTPWYNKTKTEHFLTSTGTITCYYINNTGASSSHNYGYYSHTLFRKINTDLQLQSSDSISIKSATFYYGRFDKDNMI